MSIVASRVVGEISVTGADRGVSDMRRMGSETDTTQRQLNLLRPASASASESLGGRLLGALRGTGTGFLDFASKAGMAFVGLKEFAKSAIDAGMALLRPHADLENFTASFKTFLKSDSAAKSMMQDIQKLADTIAPFESSKLAEGASNLLAMKVQSKDVVPYMTAIGNAVAGLNLESHQLGDIARLFGEIQSTGYATGETLTQLRDRGVDAYGIIRERLGLTQEQLDEQLASHKILASDALPALRDGFNAAFPDAMLNKSKTLDGRISTITDGFKKLWVETTKPIFTSISDGAGRFIEVLSSPALLTFATTTGAQIGNVMQRIGNFVMSPDFAAFVGDITYLGTQIQTTLNPAFNDLRPLADSVLANIGPTIKTVIIDIGNFAEGLGNIIKWFRDGGPPAEILKAALIGIGVAFAAIQIGSFLATLPALIVGFIGWATAAGAAAIATIAATWPLLAIGAAIALVVAGIILAVQNWGTIVNFLQGVWGSFSSWFMGALGAVGAFFVGIWNGITAGLKAAWDFIVNIVKIGVTALLVAMFAPLIAIGALFIWLYQHNTYFKLMIDSIVGVVSAGVAWLQGAFQTGFDWISQKFQEFIAIHILMWQMISGAVQTGVGAVVGFVVGAWQMISAIFASAWGTYIVGPLVAVWDAVSSFFGGIWTNYIAKPIGDMWTSLSNTIGGWKDKAIEWGKSLIKGFVDGIVSMASNVASGVGGIAQKVLEFLGFHSPTREGPGREADEWAPNFIDMYAKGLEAGIPQIEDIVGRLMKPISMGIAPMPTLSSESGEGRAYLPQGARVAPHSQLTAPQQSATPQGPTTIILQVDRYQLGKIIMPLITENARLHTGVKT